jgi:MFS family permease
VLFIVDGISYLLSALSEAFIRLPHQAHSEDLGPRAALHAYLDDTREGIAWVWQRTGIRAFLVTATTLNFLAMPIMVLLPFYVTDILGRESDWYGYLLAALGLGAAVGLGLAAGLRLEPRARGWMLRVAFLVAPFMLAGLGLVSSPWAAAALTFSVGLIGGLINIFVITLLQLSTPSEMRGRVFGLMIALARAATPVGMALGGVVGDLTGRNVPAVYVGVGVLALVVSGFAVASPAFRDFLGSDPTAAAAAPAR